jgi:hypothetical protein
LPRACNVGFDLGQSERFFDIRTHHPAITGNLVFFVGQFSNRNPTEKNRSFALFQKSQAVSSLSTYRPIFYAVLHKEIFTDLEREAAIFVRRKAVLRTMK